MARNGKVDSYEGKTPAIGDLNGFDVHSLRATAATNALDHEVDIATTRLYDRRKTRPEDSPTFKVNY